MACRRMTPLGTEAPPNDRNYTARLKNRAARALAGPTAGAGKGTEALLAAPCFMEVLVRPMAATNAGANPTESTNGSFPPGTAGKQLQKT